MAEKKYDITQIEDKWQQRWEADRLYHATVDTTKPVHYALTMYPYPSGDLHMGHWYAIVPSDTRARWMRMTGHNVLFPIGFDSFGLPAENAAIQRGIHPKIWTYDNIERMRKQLRSMGAMFDWEREITQTVSLNLEMAFDISSAGHSDQVQDILDYKTVSKRLIQIVESSEFQLVEALAEHCAAIVLAEFPIKWLRLKLSKPGAVRGSSAVGVIIEREA